MLSVFYELAFGIFLFLASLFLIPKLLSGDKKIYEIAVPFSIIFVVSILLINNLNLSILISITGTAVIYYLRSRNKI